MKIRAGGGALGQQGAPPGCSPCYSSLWETLVTVFLPVKNQNQGKFEPLTDGWRHSTFLWLHMLPAIPNNSPDLMRHATIVQRLNKHAGDEAALFYDENFWLWSQDIPNGLPWGSISSELQNEALAMGFYKKQNHSFQGKTKQIPKNPCFRINNSNGQCQRTNCP